MLNKLRLALAAFRVYRDPNRLDEVLEAATRLAKSKPEDLVIIAQGIARSSETAAKALEERVLIQYDPADLAHCPEGSVGRAVHDHCAAYGIHPSTFPERSSSTPEDFVIAHIENTHDIWHPITGFGSDRLGEIGLQAFYLAQFPNLLGLLLLGIAPLHILGNDPSEYPKLLEEVTRGWLLGKRSKPLFGVRWDTMWQRPLADVQRELGIDIEGVADVMRPGTEQTDRRLRFSSSSVGDARGNGHAVGGQAHAPFAA